VSGYFVADADGYFVAGRGGGGIAFNEVGIGIEILM
jgi:hypothetical protein